VKCTVAPAPVVAPEQVPSLGRDNPRYNDPRRPRSRSPLDDSEGLEDENRRDYRRSPSPDSADDCWDQIVPFSLTVPLSLPVPLDEGRPTVVTATAATAAIRGQRPARPT
jgi:hypothetical protein